MLHEAFECLPGQVQPIEIGVAMLDLIPDVLGENRAGREQQAAEQQAVEECAHRESPGFVL